MRLCNRETALALGLRHYFTGKACKRGHIAPRYASTKICVECGILKTREWREDNLAKSRELTRQSVTLHRRENPAHAKAYAASWRKKNPDKRRSYDEKQLRDPKKKAAKHVSSRDWHVNNREYIAAKARKKRGQVNGPTRPMPDSCEICDKLRMFDALSEDHDHETGLFRGWLCKKCNGVLGAAGDTHEKVSRYTDYLLRNCVKATT